MKVVKKLLSSFAKRKNILLGNGFSVEKVYDCKWLIDWSNTVDKKIRAERSSKLRRLSEHKLSNFYDKHIGTSRPVLFDTKKGNQIFGYTDNYIKVAAETSSFNINTVHKIDLLSNERARVFGSPAIQA